MPTLRAANLMSGDEVRRAARSVRDYLCRNYNATVINGFRRHFKRQPEDWNLHFGNMFHLQAASRRKDAPKKRTVMDTMADQSFTRSDYVEHERTYRYFVKGLAVFAALVLLTLIILAYATM